MWRAHTSALVPWQDAPGGITSRQRTPLWPQVALRRPEFGPRCAVSVPYSSREVMRRLNASCWRAAVLFQALFTCVCQRCSFGSCVVLRLSRSIAASTTASSPHAAAAPSAALNFVARHLHFQEGKRNVLVGMHCLLVVTPSKSSLVCRTLLVRQCISKVRLARPHHASHAPILLQLASSQQVQEARGSSFWCKR